MDYYDVNDPACEQYRVEYNGTFQDNALEASASEGWIKIETSKVVGWGMIQKTHKTLYGRVFIVKYESYDDEVDQQSEENPEPSYE